MVAVDHKEDKVVLMSERELDIVEELETFADIIEMSKDSARLVMLSGDLFIEAADEIKRLRENDIVLLDEDGVEYARITGDDAEFVHTAAVKTFILDAVMNSAYPDLSTRLGFIAQTGNGRISQSEANSLRLLLELQLDKHNDDLAEEVEQLSAEIEVLKGRIHYLTEELEARRG